MQDPDIHKSIYVCQKCNGKTVKEYASYIDNF